MVDQQPELEKFSEPLGGLFLKQMFLMLYSHDSHCSEVLMTGWYLILTFAYFQLYILQDKHHNFINQTWYGFILYLYL